MGTANFICQMAESSLVFGSMAKEMVEESRYLSKAQRNMEFGTMIKKYLMLLMLDEQTNFIL